MYTPSVPRLSVIGLRAPKLAAIVVIPMTRSSMYVWRPGSKKISTNSSSPRWREDQKRYFERDDEGKKWRSPRKRGGGRCLRVGDGMMRVAGK